MAHGCQSRTGRSRADTSSLGKRPRSSGAACSECGQSIFSRGLGLLTSFTADRFEVCTPNSPVFRFGRLPSPWEPPDWFWASEDGTFGNRFDDPSGNNGSSTLPHNACPASLKRWRDFVRTQCLPVHINSRKLCRQRKSMDCDGGDTVMTKSLRCAMLNL